MSAGHPPAARTPLPDLSVLFPWRAWTRHPVFRSWTTWVFVALVAVPPLALSTGTGPSGDAAATTAFGFYFAAAWFLVLRALVAPAGVTGAVLAPVAGIALVTGVPLAMATESALNASTDDLLLGIVTVGVPEELTKLLPVAALALLNRRAWHGLAPRDFLFLGAVSGLVFGAVESVLYALDPAGATGLVLVWRLLTGPVVHACWAGLSGYFLGLASRYREPGPRAAIAAVGLGLPAVLHGLNNAASDTSGPAWAAVVAVSALLLLGYARIGLVASPPRSPGPAPAAPWADPATVRIPVVTPGRGGTAPRWDGPAPRG